jgi:hypothetical protein
MKIVDVGAITSEESAKKVRKVIGQSLMLTMGGIVQSEAIVWIGPKGMKEVLGKYGLLSWDGDEIGEFVESQTLKDGIENIIRECDDVASKNGGQKLGKLRTGVSHPMVITDRADREIELLGATVLVI